MLLKHQMKPVGETSYADKEDFAREFRGVYLVLVVPVSSDITRAFVRHSPCLVVNLEMKLLADINS
jgi:hypothetical protein